MGKLRLPCLVILNQGGFREKDRSNARESDHPTDLHLPFQDARCRLESGHCHHLEDDPLEMQTLKFLAEMIVQDISFKSMAEALNIREYRTRDGRPWNAASVFRLTPRLIDVAPRILSGTEWETRKKQLTRVAWNS